jgi:two-component system chemotaxis response regulator CheY
LPKKNSASAPTPSPRPIILTVDDSKTVRRLVESALRDFACDVNEADNGYKALYAMERSMPDLLILDVNMPTMAGLPMLELLRKSDQPALKAIPVIMLTSPGDHDIAGEIAALGVSATLMKPFTPADLIAKIRGVIDLKPRV